MRVLVGCVLQRKGRIVEAKITRNGRGIVMLIFYVGREGAVFTTSRLCFRVASLSTPDAVPEGATDKNIQGNGLKDGQDLDGHVLQLSKVSIDVPLDNATTRTTGKLPLWDTGPMLDPPSSDYLYVYHKKTLKIYSLTTGQQVCASLSRSR